MNDEEGFTLIELLVVIVIIGILAAITIPVLVGQRRKATESSVKSDLRNAATFMEQYFADHAVYPTDISQLSADFRKNASTTVTIESAGAAPGSFCLRATNPGLSTFIAFDSDAGGLLRPGVACS